MQTPVIIEANRGYVLLWFLLYKEQKPCTFIQGFRDSGLEPQLLLVTETSSVWFYICFINPLRMEAMPSNERF